MPPFGILYVCKICPCLKKANGDRRRIGAAPHYFEIAAPTKVTMTMNNNNNYYYYYIWGEFSWMYLYSKSSAHQWVLNSLISFSIFIGVMSGSSSSLLVCCRCCCNRTVWYDMIYSRARFENLITRSWFRTSLSIDLLTLPINFSFLLFSSNGSLR